MTKPICVINKEWDFIKLNDLKRLKAFNYCSLKIVQLIFMKIDMLSVQSIC